MIAEPENVLVEISCPACRVAVRVSSAQLRELGIAACACGTIIRIDRAKGAALFDWNEGDVSAALPKKR